MAGGPYNIPRNTSGEGRILNIFTYKAFIATLVTVVLSLLIFYPLSSIIFGSGIVGIGVSVLLGFIAFIVTSVKIPESNNFEITRKAGGEYIFDVIKRFIVFKKQNNKVYSYFKEEKKNGK